jgi:hypothetical protein
MRVGTLCGSLLVGASLLAFSLPVSASPVADNYIGGLDKYDHTPVTSSWDVIGNSHFEVYGLDVTRPNSTDLTVTIYTNFVNHVGEDNVGLGALFIGTSAPNYNITTFSSPSTYTNSGAGSSVDGYAYDTYAADTARFQYAAQLAPSVYDPNNTGAVATPAQGLYNTASDGSNVQLANVDGNTVTHGFTGGDGSYYFRSGQAVGVTGGSTVAGTGVSYTTVSSVANPFAAGTTGELNITLSNVLGSGDIFDGLSTLYLAWAMTCANDVILASTTLGAAPPTTPLPASLPLFMGGLGLMAWLSAKRRKQKPSTMAMA